MNRKKRIVVFAGAVGLAIFSFYLSQGVIAAQRLPQLSANISGHETVGTVPARLAAPQTYFADTAMGSTINIPPNAFMPSQSGLSYSMDYSWGYLRGGGPGPCSMGAPVIFPKGAKKILHVDFWVLDADSSGMSASFGMSSLVPGSFVEPDHLFSFYTSHHGGSVFQYIKKPAKGTVWSISPNRVYYITAGLNNEVNFYGAVVYYQ